MQKLNRSRCLLFSLALPVPFPRRRIHVVQLFEGSEGCQKSSKGLYEATIKGFGFRACSIRGFWTRYR